MRALRSTALAIASFAVALSATQPQVIGATNGTRAMLPAGACSMTGAAPAIQSFGLRIVTLHAKTASVDGFVVQVDRSGATILAVNSLMNVQAVDVTAIAAVGQARAHAQSIVSTGRVSLVHTGPLSGTAHLTPLRWADVSQAVVGQSVISLGPCSSGGLTTARGVITALHRTAGDGYSYINHSAGLDALGGLASAALPGAVLLTTTGQVLGMNAGIDLSHRDFEAIPSNTLRTMAQKR